MGQGERGVNGAVARGFGLGLVRRPEKSVNLCCDAGPAGVRPVKSSASQVCPGLFHAHVERNHASRAVQIPEPFPPTVGELFLAFARVSISSFGGVLAWSRRMLVDEKRWMTPEEFNDILALCQFLPGPNIVNVSAVFGMRVRGLAGALACLSGLLGPSVLLMIVVGIFYRRFGALPRLEGMLRVSPRQPQA